jgi:hypothetical protein
MTVISAANLKWYLSGGAGNTDPLASLGGVRSTTEVTPSTIWDTVTGAETTPGDVEYRCIFFRNEDANAGGLIDAVVWIDTNTPGGDDISIALDLAGKNSAADTVASEGEAPSPALTFVAAATKGAGLSLGTLAQNDYYAIWMKRNVPALTGAYNSDTFTLKVEGDSQA